MYYGRRQENTRVFPLGGTHSLTFFPILQQRLVFAERFALGVLSYRRKYPGQSVVCHVRVGRGGIASFQKKESTTSSNTDGTLDETYACRAAFF